jgi:hypothetical protein
MDTKTDHVVTPPFRALASTGDARGHVEQQLGRKGIVCQKCLARKPKRGGWSVACGQDRRAFMGGA